MLDFAMQLHGELCSKLENLENTSNVQCYTPVECKELVALAIKRLKDELKTCRFENEIEEVCFFRGLMPAMLALYIQIGEKMRLDLIMKNYSLEDRKDCLKIFCEERDEFYRKNAEFIEYCNSRKDDLDHIYFLCADKFGMDSEELIFETMRFPLDMVYTVTLSMMFAYEVTMPYIKRLEAELEMEANILSGGGDELVWTASKTDLVELIYSLKEAGSFNDGEADVKQIAEYFEYAFSIDLGNISSTFQKMLSRKKGQLTYIDKLRTHLNQKIDDMDNRSLQ
jgi:RteC protein